MQRPREEAVSRVESRACHCSGVGHRLDVEGNNLVHVCVFQMDEGRRPAPIFISVPLTLPSSRLPFARQGPLSSSSLETFEESGLLREREPCRRDGHRRGQRRSHRFL